MTFDNCATVPGNGVDEHFGPAVGWVDSEEYAGCIRLDVALNDGVDFVALRTVGAAGFAGGNGAQGLQEIGFAGDVHDARVLAGKRLLGTVFGFGRRANGD